LKPKRYAFIEMPGQYDGRFKTKRTNILQSISPGSKYVINRIPNCDVFLFPNIPKLIDYDFIFISFMFVRQYFYIFPFFKKAGIHPNKEKRKEKVIIGGHCLHNPYPLRQFFNAAIIGDGEDTIIDFLNNPESEIDGVYRFKNGEKVKKRFCSNIDANPIVFQYGKNTPYIEIGRGCKSKCNFCELGWTHIFREAAKDEVIKKIEQIPQESRRIHFLAGDEGSVKNFLYYIELAKSRNLKTTYSSIKFASFHGGIKYGRFGVEGLTDKWRKFYGKNLKASDIKNITNQAVESGCTRFRFFYIIGIGESEQDWLEHDEFIKSLRGNKRFLLELNLTAFVPIPGTPLENYPLSYSRNYYNRIKDKEKKPYRGKDKVVYYRTIPSPASQQIDTFLYWCPNLYDFLRTCWKYGESKITRRRKYQSQERDYRRIAIKLGYDWDGIMKGKREPTCVINPHEKQRAEIKPKINCR